MVITASSAGLYRDGLPDGWCSFYPPDDDLSTTGSLHVLFSDGHLNSSTAVFVDADKRVWIGQYDNGELDNFLHMIIKISINEMFLFNYRKPAK